MSTTTPIYSLLRIKRKRTTSSAPLDALLIDSTSNPSPSPSANKRRRQHPPPAAAAPPSTATAPPTTTTSNRGIFRFAETVPLDEFDDSTKTRRLKDRIAAFLAHPPSAALSRVSSSTSLHAPSTPPTPTTRKGPSGAASLRGARPTASSTTSAGHESPKDARVKGFHAESKRARYRIIERQRSTAEGLGGSWGGSGKVDMSAGARGSARPPTVVAAADLLTAKDQMKIYDAVEEEQPLARRAHLLSPTNEDTEMNSQFASMLEEYLTLQDGPPSAASAPILAPPVELPPPPVEQEEAEEEEEEDGDFVYDVYYRDLRPEAVGARALGAVGGGAAAGGGMDVSGWDGLKRVGELAGLEDDEILDDGELSEEEEEDQDDQDSNEENDYRNDYPDGEDQESDFSGDGEGAGGGGFGGYRDGEDDDEDAGWSD